MKKNTTSTPTVKNAAPATTSSTMTAAEFKQKSYDAYLAYVEFIEGKKSITETVETLSPLMTAFGKDKGEQAKKVKSISTFRAFVKGGWKDVAAAPVHANAGKNPADAKPAKSKQPTKADLQAEIEALRAQLAQSASKAA